MNFEMKCLVKSFDLAKYICLIIVWTVSSQMSAFLVHLAPLLPVLFQQKVTFIIISEWGCPLSFDELFCPWYNIMLTGYQILKH